MSAVFLTGGSSGLGKSIGANLLEAGHIVYAPTMDEMDLQFPEQISDLANVLVKLEDEFDCLINCAGVNHIDWFENLDCDDWDFVMDINARGTFLLSNEMVKKGLLRKGGTILNIISNASHMPMTHSAVYNASKGAQHILTLQMARELKKTHDITVFGISPNKLKGTRMSAEIEKRVMMLRGWTAEEAEKYQLASLPAGEETDPDQVAQLIAYLLHNKDRHKYLNGCIIPYGA
jgi:sorbitol-6-phosphate 2-dehydrogenase